jgi:hypothetical protein
LTITHAHLRATLFSGLPPDIAARAAAIGETAPRVPSIGGEPRSVIEGVIVLTMMPAGGLANSAKTATHRAPDRLADQTALAGTALTLHCAEWVGPGAAIRRVQLPAIPLHRPRVCRVEAQTTFSNGRTFRKPGPAIAERRCSTWTLMPHEQKTEVNATAAKIGRFTRQMLTGRAGRSTLRHKNDASDRMPERPYTDLS